MHSVKKVTHFNDIKLQQFQVIHSLFPASPFFKKRQSSTDINMAIKQPVSSKLKLKRC